MATVPYQSTYSLNPQYGTRYGPSQFAPAQAPVGSAQTLGTQSPAVMGAGAGQAGQTTTQPLAYNQDPFTQASTGFRSGSTVTYASAPGGQTPTTVTQPAAVPATTNAVTDTIQAMQIADSGSDNVPGYDRIPAAQSLGYQQGTQNPLGIVLGAMPFGSVLADALDLNKDYTYGSYGTYDAEGNVFGPSGRAYDPITGRPAASYASPSDWYGGWLGLGTEEGFGGPSSSYGKLRAAGEDIPNSLLGSYENSIYRQMEQQPGLGIVGARAARMRGEGAPFGTIADKVAINTQIARGDYTGLSGDDIDRMQGTTITAADLGFTSARPMPDNISGRFGTKSGDIVGLDNGMFGVINESGTISTPTGTVVSLSDSMNPGQSISLLDQSFSNKVKIQQELDIRAGTPASSCFPANTQITMADGTTKAISEINVGDKVLAFTQDNNLIEDEVTETHKHTTSRSTDYMVKIILQNNKELITTSNHPIYMPEHNGFKWAGFFEPGELVMLKDGMMFAVASIENLGEITEPVYNFEVKATHTYIADDIRVHNGSGEGDSSDGPSDEDIDQELQQDIAMAAHAASTTGADRGYDYSESFNANDPSTAAAIGATQDVLGAASEAKAAGTDMQAAIDAKTSALASDPSVTNAINNLAMVTDYKSTYK